MKDVLAVLAVFFIYYGLNKWILPKLGVST